MSVGDVGVGHRHAGFLHLGDISEGVLGKGPVESRETAATEGVGDGSTARVIYADIVVGLRRNARPDRLVNIFGAVERVVAKIATRLVGKLVEPRVCCIGCVRGADAPALSAVDRDADVVRVRLRAKRGSGWCRHRDVRVGPLRRAGAEGLAPIADWASPNLLAPN